MTALFLSAAISHGRHAHQIWLYETFLWGYLKSLVYADRPRSTTHLKDNIPNAIANAPIEMLQREMVNFKNRLNQCMHNGGRHLADVIFKTI